MIIIDMQRKLIYNIAYLINVKKEQAFVIEYAKQLYA